MGNDTSRPTGTDFESNEKTREQDTAAEDLPTIPIGKQKAINADLEEQLKKCIFYQNFKRAFRGYLRKKPERNQTGTLFRLQTHSFRDGDLLGLPKDSYYGFIDNMVIKFIPELEEDFLEFLIGRKKLFPQDPPLKKKQECERYLGIVMKHMTDIWIQGQAKKMYEKYSRGDDFEISDVEIDPETRAKMEAARQEKLRKAAEERQKQAAEWKKQAEEEERLQELRQAEVAKRVAEAKAIRDASLI